MTRRFMWPGWLFLTAVVTLCLWCPLGAQDTGLEPPPEAQNLGQLLFNIRHCIQIGDFPLATKYINALLAKNPDPAAVLKAVQDDPVLNHRDTGLVVLLTKIVSDTSGRAGTAELRKAGESLLALIKSGYIKSIRDPKVVKEEIAKLGSPSPRVQSEAMANLREMAPWSVPLMVDTLWNDEEAAVRPAVILSLPKMGRGAVEVLCEALDVPEAVPAKVNIVQALAVIGYPQAIPYIQQVLEQTDSEQLKTACRSAVESLRISPRATFSGSAGQMFTQLGEGYYSDQPSLRPTVSADLVPVWSYQPKVGVVSVEVPRAIYMDVMAKGVLRRALKLDSNQPEAVSLWLSANIRRESLLPAGAKDPTVPDGQPNAHYYAVAAGPGYLLRGLARALADNESAVALGVVRALNDVGFAGTAEAQAGALAVALGSPDRKVRYEAALVIAMAHLKTKLAGTEMVVPILAEALGQTGERYAIALLAKGAEQDKLAEQVRAAGYRLDVVATRNEVFERVRSANVPHVSLVVIGYELAEGGLAGLAEIRKDYRFRHVPALLVATATDVAEAAVKNVAAVGVIQDSAQAADIKDKVDKMQVKSGGTEITPDEAKGYALRAAGALREIALSATPGMDFLQATPALVRALADSRQELAVAAAGALGYADETTAQRALAAAAMEAKADPARRVALFKALAGSAKRFGNKLTEDQVNGIIRTAMEEQNLEVRNAAAAAMGALNLPSVKIDALIRAAQ